MARTTVNYQGFRWIINLDDMTVKAIHGEYCLGCDLKRGRCGEMTSRWIYNEAPNIVVAGIMK